MPVIFPCKPRESAVLNVHQKPLRLKTGRGSEIRTSLNLLFSELKNQYSEDELTAILTVLLKEPQIFLRISLDSSLYELMKRWGLLSSEIKQVLLLIAKKGGK